MIAKPYAIGLYETSTSPLCSCLILKHRATASGLYSSPSLANQGLASMQSSLRRLSYPHLQKAATFHPKYSTCMGFAAC